MPKPIFRPWKPGHFNGTLIIGESCPKGDETAGKTGWKDHPDSEWPYKFIVNHVKINGYLDKDTFKILRLSFLYDGKELDPKEFWQQHAFTNLVPRLMDRDVNNKIKRPNNGKDKWDAREQFPLIIEYVKPKRVLIASGWGVESLKELFDDKKYYSPFKSKGDIWKMTYKGIPMVGIYHPMYRAYTKDTFIATARKATELLQNISIE
ncbi:MAG: hypothetical protein JW976_14010 [Syntrophaceae bacterium]|nr:hypothetical protein [Syntrophaceae bacterium]